MMHTIRQQFLALFFITLLYTGCCAAFAETAVHKTEGHTQSNLNLSGLYLGFLPCDDCQGIRTTLALNKNNTYVYITLYVGKSDREFVEKGKFALGEKANTIVLTPRKNGTVQHYLVGEDSLTKLDENGNPITGSSADRYIFRRKDVTKAPSFHSGH